MAGLQGMVAGAAERLTATLAESAAMASHVNGVMEGVMRHNLHLASEVRAEVNRAEVRPAAAGAAPAAEEGEELSLIHI